MLYSFSMENSRRTEFHITFPDGPSCRRILRFFAAVSTLYGFWIIYDMDRYLPWQVRFVRGIEITFVTHFGLWLATFEIRGWLRFVVAAALFLSIFGIFFLWWTLDLFAAIVALGCVSWLFFWVLKGKRFGD
jgi:hypothetical protein